MQDSMKNSTRDLTHMVCKIMFQGETISLNDVNKQ